MVFQEPEELWVAFLRAKSDLGGVSGTEGFLGAEICLDVHGLTNLLACLLACMLAYLLA